MYSIAAFDRLASAAAVRLGRYGDVARLAHQRGCSRQALYRQAHAALAALDRPGDDPRLAALRRRLAEAEGQLAALRQQLAQAVVLGEGQLAQFASTAQAQGTSLTCARALLEVLRPGRAPSLARLGRLSAAAAGRAAAALAVLDGFARPRARQVAADEIFAGKRPVLATLEQDSLCWLGGRLAADRDGPTWAQEFQQLPAAEQVTRDGGQGLRKGLELVNRQRRASGQGAIADQDDHFHLLQRARRALREVRAKATRALRQAEQAQQAADRRRRRGLRAARQVGVANRRWQLATAAFDRWAAHERACERLRAALGLFTPAGELNTRQRAEAEVRAALAELTGPEWARARRRLVVPQTFTFLDRVQQQLAQVPLPEAVKAQVVRCEGLRRRPALLRGEGAPAAALRGLVLVAGAALALLGPAGAAAAEAVRGVLRGAWRSSSLVEGLNSVLRMHQRRQKRLTQGLLDLKRLHWNVHRFRAGRRKGQSPYERLGVVLPPGSWWDLLSKPPEQLQRELSALNPAA